MRLIVCTRLSNSTAEIIRKELNEEVVCERPTCDIHNPFLMTSRPFHFSFIWRVRAQRKYDAWCER
jgi:hypothetical protein